ncbi:BTB/POZ domain family protein [Acanthocheilonema viteae]
MVHLKGHDFRRHCNSIGQYLRELRVKRDLITADVTIICAQMQTDFLHSTIGAIYSNCIRRMLKCHQTPLLISLLNRPYKVVSAVIDWMYTGQIQVTAEEYGEHLKVVSSLGVEKLQQNMESRLQALAAQNDRIICCINIATDPECSVSFMVQEMICKKFVVTMHSLSNTDIQKLTLNAITALVASPNIKSKEKIDTINFALQWLKNSAHSRFLDVVLGSLHMEMLKPDQLIVLVQHLQRLYRELPQNLLESIHIYICNKRIVISSNSRKSGSVIVPNFSADVSETESEYRNAETGKMDAEVNTSYIAEIDKLPSFEDSIKVD